MGSASRRAQYSFPRYGGSRETLLCITTRRGSCLRDIWPRSRSRNPAGFVFGFGRRICPGRRLADSTLFLAIAKVLAAFDVSKARDAEGREIEPEIGIGPGAVTGPLPFSVAVTPRNEAVAQLVRAMDEEYTVGEGDAKYLDQDIWDIIT